MINYLFACAKILTLNVLTFLAIFPSIFYFYYFYILLNTEYSTDNLVYFIISFITIPIISYVSRVLITMIDD